MIRKNYKLQKDMIFHLPIIIIQSISDIFYSIQEFSGIFMGFSSREISRSSIGLGQKGQVQEERRKRTIVQQRRSDQR